MANLAAQDKLENRLGTKRIFIGLIQGFLLYLLYSANDAHIWPSTVPEIFSPLCILALFIPLVVIQALGNLRFLTLFIWALALTVILWGTAYYDVWNNVGSSHFYFFGKTSGQYLYFITVAIFIAQALVTSSDSEQRLIASYPTYFDIAWKLTVQIILACFFVGIFWSLLWLSAAAFMLIKIDIVERIISDSVFAIPATTVAITAALHVTDVKVAMVRGVRTLILTLLSWLLPILAIFALFFLISLLFRGFSLLWQTKLTTFTLIAFLGWLIILINAVYQNGHATPGGFLRYMSRVGCVLLLPLLLLIGFSIKLLVDSEGWLTSTIYITAYTIILGSYSIGYVIAAFKRGPWLHFIEFCNIWTAFLILMIIFCLLTPIANPDRLSVGNQLNRLAEGKVTPQQFNFKYLHWETSRYGLEGLQNLAKNSQNPLIKTLATEELAKENQFYIPKKIDSALPTAANLPAQSNLVTGDKLPDSFLNQKIQKQSSFFAMPECISYKSVECKIFVRDINQDGKKEVLILENFQLSVFQEINGRWQMIGFWNLRRCPKENFEVVQGLIETVSPQTSWPDLLIMGKRFPFIRIPLNLCNE